MAMKLSTLLIIIQAFWEESNSYTWPQDTPGEHLWRKLQLSQLCEDTYLLEYLANAT